LHDAEKSGIIENIGPGDQSCFKSWRIIMTGSPIVRNWLDEPGHDMIITRKNDFDNRPFRLKAGRFVM